MSWLFSTDRGLEDLVVDELAERSGAAVTAVTLPGLILADLPAGLEWQGLRLVHDVAALHVDARVASLQDLRDALTVVELPELAAADSFRVTARASGRQSFSHREAAGAAGAVLQRRHGTAVNLEQPDLVLRLDLVDDRVLLSSQLNREPLSKRVRRGRSLRGSLRPTLAAAMLRLGDAHRGGGSLLDPTCGSGTILVEAAVMNPELELFASDWDAPTLEVARGTFANHEVKADLRQVDARELASAWGRRFDLVLSNPPFGIRLGRRVSLTELYSALARSFLEVLEPAGRLVVVTPRRKALARALAGLPVTIVDERPVEAGGLTPVLYLIRPS